MQLAAAKRRYELLHEEKPYHDGVVKDGRFVNWSAEPSPVFPYHWRDGVSIFMAPKDLGLGGDFLGQGLVPQQAPGEQTEPPD